MGYLEQHDLGADSVAFHRQVTIGLLSHCADVFGQGTPNADHVALANKVIGDPQRFGRLFALTIAAVWTAGITTDAEVKARVGTAFPFFANALNAGAIT